MKLSVSCVEKWHSVGFFVATLIMGWAVEEVRGQPSSAACCLPNGSCTVVNAPFECTNQGGEFVGNSATCNLVVCTGACCLPNKSCANMGTADCVSSAGAYQGRGSVCGDDCPSVMPTAFTYQGQLKRAGIPVNELVSGKFSLWLSPTGTDPANQIGSTLTINSIEVANGLFSVPLDFGQNAFNGNARWLQIEIHGHNDAPGVFTTLSPRQSLTPSPYSIETRGIVVTANGNVGIGTKTPVSKLHVLSGANDGAARLQSSGTGGFSAGWDFYQGAVGKGYVGVPDSAAAFGAGEMLLFGGPGTSVSLWAGQARAVTVEPSGNVGIGTPAPDVKLQVVEGSDSAPGGGGFIVAGPTNGANISIDNNEIMARNNGAISTLFINNDGGDVKFGGAIDIGLEDIETPAIDGTEATLECPAGKRALSGGCWCGASNIQDSRSQGTGWRCRCEGQILGDERVIVKVRCARVKG